MNRADGLELFEIARCRLGLRVVERVGLSRTARGERAKRGGAKCVNNFSGREKRARCVDGRVITRVSALTSALALTSGSGYSFSWRVAPLAPQLMSIRVLCDAALWEMRFCHETSIVSERYFR